MFLTERHVIKRNDARFTAIDEMALKSKNLYNASLYAVRHHFFLTGKMLSYNVLQKEFQNANQIEYRQLPAKVAQAIMQMVELNFKNFFKALSRYKVNPKGFTGQPKLPKYLDKNNGRYLLLFSKQTIFKKDLQKHKLLNLSSLKLSIATSIKYDNIKQVRIIKKLNNYIIEIVYQASFPDTLCDNNRYAAIDLGVNNLATVVSNVSGVKPYIISGKKLKSINHKYNKDIAKAKSILELRNNQKTSKCTQKITSKRNERINDYLHKTSRIIVNQLLASNINTLIIGKNKGWKQDINIGASNNQNFVQIPHSRLIEMLQYKCALCGINVEITEESYTSKCSFLDNEKIQKHKKYVGKRIYRGLFRSSNGILINADVNGAYNILRKCKPNAYANGVMGVVVHPTIIKIVN